MLLNQHAMQNERWRQAGCLCVEGPRFEFGNLSVWKSEKEWNNVEREAEIKTDKVEIKGERAVERKG